MYTNKNVIRSLVLAAFTLAIFSAINKPVSATTLDITPTWVPLTNTSGNGGRVSFQGFADGFWANVDVGATNVQQYAYMNIGTGWQSSVTGPITSATLTFAGATANYSSPAVTFKVFEIPGSAGPTDYGRTAIDNFNSPGVTGGELTAWYAGHTGYGSGVTISAINGPNAVSWDITALLEGWRTHTLSANEGYMMILNDTINGGTVTWGTESGSAPPTISVTFEEAVVPEPSTFVLAALGLAGLGLVAWRKRK
jgi:hypothetical protein